MSGYLLQLDIETPHGGPVIVTAKDDDTLILTWGVGAGGGSCPACHWVPDGYSPPPHDWGSRSGWYYERGIPFMGELTVAASDGRAVNVKVSP